MALNTIIRATIRASQTNPLDQGTAEFHAEVSAVIELKDGVLANQANMMFSDKRTLASGANENIDIAGVLTSAYGAVLTFVKLKAIMIRSLPTNTTNMNVTRPASLGTEATGFLAAGDGVQLKPGGVFLICNPGLEGLGSVSGGNDLINVSAASGASLDYEIILVGTSS